MREFVFQMVLIPVTLDSASFYFIEYRIAKYVINDIPDLQRASSSYVVRIPLSCLLCLSVCVCVYVCVSRYGYHAAPLHVHVPKIESSIRKCEAHRSRHGDMWHSMCTSMYACVYTNASMYACMHTNASAPFRTNLCPLREAQPSKATKSSSTSCLIHCSALRKANCGYLPPSLNSAKFASQVCSCLFSATSGTAGCQTVFFCSETVLV